MISGFFFAQHLQHIADFLQSDSAFRPLAPEEIRELEQQHCSSEDWSSVRVSDPWLPELVSNTVFSGSVLIDSGQAYSLHPLVSGSENTRMHNGIPRGIRNSRIHNSFIGSGCCIHNCSLISNSFLEPGSVVFDSCLEAGDDSFPFGVGTPMKLLNEAHPTPYLLTADETMDAIRDSLHRARLESWQDTADEDQQPTSSPKERIPQNLRSMNIISSKARLMHTNSAASIYLGPDCSISNPGEVRRCAVLGGVVLEGSYTSLPASIGSGCVVIDSVLQPGSKINSQARVYRSAILETGGAENGALIRDSIIGPGSIIGQGEATASIIGPLVGQHHHSLLIASDWSAGHGNIGYGANVGSNHSTRMADLEARIGEGVFFGLDCAVQFPINLTEAPYTTVATGTILLAQRLTMPFSLMVPPASIPDPNLSTISPGANRIIPGWSLHSNMFSVIRNWIKYQSRFHAKLHKINSSPFRAEIRNLMKKAIDELMNIHFSPGQDFISPADCPGIGASILYPKDIERAIKAYQNAIRFGELSEKPTEELGADEREELINIIENMICQVKKSRSKDYAMRRRIFPEDFQQSTEPEPAHDPCGSGMKPLPDPALSAALNPLENMLMKLRSSSSAA